MKSLIVEGGQVPKGIINISGAKNSALRILAATAMFDNEVCLHNYPTQIFDSVEKIKFLNEMGVIVDIDSENNICKVNPINLKSVKDDSNFEIPIRTTYLLAAAQLRKFKEAKIPYPGGCKIGNRKYDVHIDIWEKFGCVVTECEKYIHIKLKESEMKPAFINFPISTVGGTENALLCGSITKGRSVLSNAYITPEVNDLISFLKKGGVKIEIYGSSEIHIQGCNRLNISSYEIMSDRIEALTWLVYGAISGGNIEIRNFPFEIMEIPLLHLNHAGIDFFRNSKSLIINSGCIDGEFIEPFELACGTYPGIVSDMMPFYVLLALKAKGRSKVFDYRYPERNLFCKELNKFVEDSIEYIEGKTTIYGPAQFNAAECNSTDLRGSMVLILAALLSKNGISVVNNIDLALRGYDKLLDKLRSVGINFKIQNY